MYFLCFVKRVVQPYVKLTSVAVANMADDRGEAEVKETEMEKNEDKSEDSEESMEEESDDEELFEVERIISRKKQKVSEIL